MAMAAIAAGSALGGLGASVIGGNAAKKIAARAQAAAQAQYEAAQRERDAAVARLESIGIPTVEAQRIVLESPELVGLEQFQAQGPSEFENLSSDPRLREAQMGALSSLQQMSGSGLTEGERAAQELSMQRAAGLAQSRDAALKQDLAEKGMLDSGVGIAMRQSAGQASAQQAMQEQLLNQQAAQARALQAIQASAQLGGQVRGQDYEQEAQRAQAADSIARFNAQQQADISRANLNRRQDIENQRTNTVNQQEAHNKGLLQSDFGNRLALGQSVANARTGNASAIQAQGDQALKFGQASAQGKIDQGAAMSNLFGQLGSAGIQYAANKKADGGIMEYRPRYAGGGLPVPHPETPYENESPQEETQDVAGEGSVFTGNNFAGDRVDAKVNSGEMILNLEQQQRLMDLLKGYRSLAGLGNGDIVEPVAPGQMPSPDFDPGASGAMVPNEMAHGGVAKAPPKEHPVRGLSEMHSKMTKQNEQLGNASKDTKAKIKALETLMGFNK